jgi:4-methylaminobutanoate oxidase (formaldehyde-forming)
MISSRTSDIIIVGGGIIGNAIAFYLSQKTKAGILVIEQNVLCTGSTALAGSLIIRLRSQVNLIPLIEETHKAVAWLNAETGELLGEHKVGCLHVATSESTLNEQSELLKIASDLKIDTENADISFIEKNVPWLKTDKIVKATFVPDEFYLDGIKLGLAYARIARQNGVRYLLNSHVSEILILEEKVIGVRVNGDYIYAPVVINAAGIWTNILLEKINALVPSAPVRSLYFVTETNRKKFPVDQPICVLPDVKSFTRPYNGALLFGIRDSHSSYTHPNQLPRHIGNKKYINSDEIWCILKKEATEFRQLIKNPEETDIIQWVAAPCAYTHDSYPVIGKIDGIEGLFAATGCSGGGIAASAGFGRLMAEQVLNEPTFVNAEPFNPARIPEANPYSDEFMQLCSLQRSGKKSG